VVSTASLSPAQRWLQQVTCARYFDVVTMASVPLNLNCRPAQASCCWCSTTCKDYLVQLEQLDVHAWAVGCSEDRANSIPREHGNMGTTRVTKNIFHVALVASV
jgi:hypothetical protein